MFHLRVSSFFPNAFMSLHIVLHGTDGNLGAYEKSTIGQSGSSQTGGGGWQRGRSDGSRSQSDHPRPSKWPSRGVARTRHHPTGQALGFPSREAETVNGQGTSDG